MIRCEITAHTLDLTAHWPLYVHQAATPRTAMRWLRWQAGVLADRLDPDPRTPWIPRGALRGVGEAVPDAPLHLRYWADDITAYEQAMSQLAGNEAVCLATHDDTAYYTLTAVPPQSHAAPKAPWAPHAQGIA
jgi:hypothetical protein